MGAGVVILMWLIILGFFAVIWGILVAATIYGWKRKKMWIKWCAGVPAALMLFGGLLAGILTVYGLIDSMNPKSVFENTFGTPPSPSISDIKSNLYWFADTGSTYLRFNISEVEFRKLMPSGLTECTMQKIKADLPTETGSKIPTWWTHDYQPGWLYFMRDDFNKEQPQKKGFHSELEYFIYDPNSKTAYYHFLGID